MVLIDLFVFAPLHIRRIGKPLDIALTIATGSHATQGGENNFIHAVALGSLHCWGLKRVKDI
ncbi:MAG: hypothetical protein GKR94_17415 [Gammaproteobacteria bacterium]|nr:hypothetical protein [Gammaproteobacteria bacterium]